MRHALFRCGPIRAPRGLAVVVALLAVLALAALTACQRDAGPQLIEALDLVPHEVERGDRVELIGASFPAGKKAHVTFRGELHRPGEKAASAEIAAASAEHQYCADAIRKLMRTDRWRKAARGGTK